MYVYVWPHVMYAYPRVIFFLIKIHKKIKKLTTPKVVAFYIFDVFNVPTGSVTVVATISKLRIHTLSHLASFSTSLPQRFIDINMKTILF